jgi:putative ABC transport system substrate-binding protein
VQKAAPALGLSIRLEHASSDGEIEKAWDRFSEHRVGAVAVAADALFNSRRVQIVGLAVRHRLPAIYFLRDFVDAGGLISYGGSPNDAYRLAGNYAGRILV